MALKPKHPHICIDEQIWDDPVMIGISPSAFRSYIFAIAWSKRQAGRTRDGLLTDHGITRIGATPDDVECLVNNGLIEKCDDGYMILKWDEWQVTAAEAEEQRAAQAQARAAEEQKLIEIEEQKERQRQFGLQGAKKRWQTAAPPPLEEGFNVDQAFEEAWGEWPEAVDHKFREKREEAYASFRANITNTKDFADFSQALMKRINDYEKESKPKAERRKFLGAFKNFCDGRWKDWMPKSHRMYREPPAPVTSPAQPEEPQPETLFDKQFREFQEEEARKASQIR